VNDQVVVETALSSTVKECDLSSSIPVIQNPDGSINAEDGILKVLICVNFN
jgi:hypothetical protein